MLAQPLQKLSDHGILAHFSPQFEDAFNVTGLDHRKRLASLNRPVLAVAELEEVHMLAVVLPDFGNAERREALQSRR